MYFSKNPICPICKEEAKSVLAKTLNSLLKDKTKKKLDSLNGFYICKTSTCKVIYFRSNEVLTQEDLNVSVGFKEGAKKETYCYCFGWTKPKMVEDIKKHGRSTAIEDIKANMDSIGCSCEVKNPSGKCCMSDVKKVVSMLL